MQLGIDGKRALITASGRGLGRGIATSLAAEGAKICAVARTKSDIDDLMRELGGEASGHLGVALDLESDDGPSRLLAALTEHGFGPVDIVVHNLGGTLDINDPFCPVSDWRRVWRANLETAVEINQALLPVMQERKWGRVVMISSISAMENHGPVPYCAVKAAVTAYARSMGRVLAPDGVVMTAVLPGAVMTTGGYWDIAAKNRPEHVERYLNDRMAIRRFGRVDEISNVVAFLCSAHASFCVGSIFPVDGGQGRSFFGQ